MISQNQKLSEQFIEKFQDKVKWYGISLYQKLSEQFIEKFQDKADWYWISKYQKLSEQFIEKFQDKISIDYETNWLYWTIDQKLSYIKENNVPYELVDNNIIAYKSTSDDGYSVYNFQYKYEVGKIYESHCNCNSNEENSFGLSAWTKEGALDYHSKGELYKVKIAIDDIGCFVIFNNSIHMIKLALNEKKLKHK